MIIPRHAHEHDVKWIEGLLGYVPDIYQQKVCSNYDAIYRDAYQAEPTEHRKVNAARTAANTRLRVYLSRALK